MIGVRRFRNILFALAAFLWLPVAAHCQLETVPGLEFLRCSTAAQSSPGPNGHCGDGGCCSVEKSQYRTDQFRVTLASANWLPVSPPPILDAANTLPEEVSLGILTAAPPPPLLKTWQFSLRTALPVRAPSLAS